MEGLGVERNDLESLKWSYLYFEMLSGDAGEGMVLLRERLESNLSVPQRNLAKARANRVIQRIVVTSNNLDAFSTKSP